LQEFIDTATQWVYGWSRLVTAWAQLGGGHGGRIPPLFQTGNIICMSSHTFFFRFRNILVSHQAVPPHLTTNLCPWVTDHKEAEVAEVKPSQNLPLHSRTALNPYKFQQQKPNQWVTTTTRSKRSNK